MFYQPDLMAYLWMLPVLLMVVLPALWTTSCMLYRAVERSRLVDVRGFIEVGHHQDVETADQERRKSTRIRIDGPKAKVARKVKCCHTHVANISCHGICLANIPRKVMSDEEGRLKVVFRTREKDYAMLVQPKWKERVGNVYVLGAEIIKYPQGWDYFVKGLCRPFVAEPA